MSRFDPRTSPQNTSDRKSAILTLSILPAMQTTLRENPGKSGWRLSDGNLLAHEIKKMADTGFMPALIFSNACQSARTDEWNLKSHFQNEIFGLANAFILSGVKHYIGTFWEVLDEPSKRFAIEFYRHLFESKTVGEAVRMARLDLMDEYGEEAIVWASYLLYGDPTFNYMSHILPDEVLGRTRRTCPGN